MSDDSMESFDRQYTSEKFNRKYNKDNFPVPYETLATSCPSSAKVVGQNIVLTINISQGTPNFTIQYKKDGAIIVSQTQSAIGTYTFVYTTTNADLGSHTYTVSVTDSCTPPNTWSDSGCVITVNSASLADVKIEPSSQNVQNGTQFSVNLVINPNGNFLSGYQFNLSFNPAFVSIVSVTEGNLLKQGGRSTFYSQGTINNTAGTLINSFAAILGPYYVTTTGTAATILFNTIAPGISALSLSNVKLSDNNAQPILFNQTNGTVNVNSTCSAPTCSFTMSS